MARCPHLLSFLLPFQLHLCNDPAARVRVSALDTLTMCIRLVKDLPRNDANIFPEYVLPSIAPLAVDNSVVVRIAYARNVGKLKYVVTTILVAIPNENEIQ